MGVNHDVIAAVANHKQRDITGRVYIRYTYDKEKRRALQTWGRRLEAIVHHGVRSTERRASRHDRSQVRRSLAQPRTLGARDS